MSTSPPIVEPPHMIGELRELKLPAIALHWQRLALEASRKRQAHPEYLADLIHLEVTQRRERGIARRVGEAHFPMLKTIDGFIFEDQPSIDREQLLGLFRCGFVEEKSNVVLLGGVGTGKTHLAISLGIACCQHGHRVRFVTAAELTTALVEAKRDGRLSRRLDQMARFDVVVLDELGYVPFDKEGSDLLFSFITKVYERRSLIITTNLPFGRWGEVFQDATAAAAVIDRIVHHATIIKTEGESYRLRDAKRRTNPRARKEDATP